MNLKRIAERLGSPAVIGPLLGVLIVVIAANVALRVSRSTAAPIPATPTPILQGTDMHKHLAPGFSLTDQNGNTVSLQALRGHPVVLTFVDATCTEQCPIMIQYLNWTAQQFMTPQQVAQVEWVAISVNPHNTPAQAQEFLTKNKAAIPMHFLLGTQAQLQPLWKAYYIEVEPGQTDVVHTSGLYVLDQQGRERVWFDAGFDPKALSGDLQALLSGRA